ncbi:MAG: ATP-binding cassette domain-containing protein [Nitrospirae bacterium]|nr:ATP-binding cassette domain-containing protein [Nitrospirota bacterium]MBI5695330.1 ATP-binding cassette domain-containing protein [Nitrospirota bacterium]
MIHLEHVYLALGDAPILKDVSLDLNKGETGVILGSSGSGKTTILRLLLGLYRPDSGRVFVNGDEVSAMGEDDLYRVRGMMGMVFQGGALFDSLTVGENVAYRLTERDELDDEEVETRVRKSLGFVGLEDSIDLMPAELSGGMKKRVAIARGIAASPKMMLYDEPTAGLDPINSFNVIRLIKKLKESEGVTSVVVTHDLVAAFEVADRIAFIHEGELVYVGDRDGVLACRDTRVHEFLGRSGCVALFSGNGAPAGYSMSGIGRDKV